MIVSNWDKERLLRSTILAGFAAFTVAGATAVAQESDEEEPQSTEEQAATSEDRIVVTGSRIARSSFDTTQPSEIIGSEEIELRGYTNAIDAVLDIPGVFGNTPIGDQSAAGVGQNLPNLFGLGTNRTLTLLDGRRFVSSNSPVDGSGAPGAQVDLNNIPVALIERVEVVKVGGAAVYGSDAVAGVINYILRDDYEGFEVAADYTQWGEDNIGDEYSMRAVIGGNFDNGRGNIVASLEYNETSPVIESDVNDLANNWSRFTPIAANRVPDPDTGVAPTSQVQIVQFATAGILSFSGLLTPGTSAISNIGVGRFPDGNFYQFNPDGSGTLVGYDPGLPTGNLVWASGGDGLTIDRFTPLRSPVERFNFSTFVNYEINEWVNLSVDIFANQFEGTEPVKQPEYSSGLFGGTGSSLFIPIDYAYLDSSVVSLLNANSLPGFYLQRGFVGVGEDSAFNETTVFSYNIGLDGDFSFLDRDFTWELAYQTGNSQIFANTPDVANERWFAAIDVGINPATGQIDCRFNYEAGYDDRRAGSLGVIDDIGPLGEPGDCIPFNPLGDTENQDASYFEVNYQSFTELEQEILSGFVSTEAYELPAGDIGVATGFEYRREFATYEPSSGGVLSTLRENVESPTGGEYYTFDVYAEALVPLIGGDFTPVPLLETADVEASYRLINNTRSGLDEAWAVGMALGFIENVDLRANVARTVRAPAVTELFLPRVQIGAFATDPCSSNNITSGPNPAVRAANCANDVPAGFISQAQNASVAGFTGGNPGLGNETADSYNIGLVFSPRWVPGLTVSADYINITIQDRIVSFTLTQIMNACYDSSNFPNSFCNQFVRLPNGQLPSLNAFESGFVNAASSQFDSVEIAARYVTDLNDVFFLNSFEQDLGTFDASLRVYNLQTNSTSNTGFDFNDTVGNRSNPEWRGDIRAQWYRGPLTLFTDVEYTGSGVVSKFAVPYQYIGVDGENIYNLDGSTIFDFGGSYDFNNVTFRASVNNVFNYGPDIPNMALRGDYNIGRIYNVGITARF